jgi:outer membrane receptor protein involved in Fe transport
MCAARSAPSGADHLGSAQGHAVPQWRRAGALQLWHADRLGLPERGDGAKSQIALSPSQTRYNAFLHGEYQLSDAVTLFAEGLYARTHTSEASNYLQDVGSALQYTIYRDNAYLPASVAALMDANKITSFTVGKFEGDLPLSVLDSKIDAYHALAGLKGSIGSKWNWDVSYNYGRSDQRLAQNNLTSNRQLYASTDAVVNPANGQLVCRSTLSGMDAGCVPRNIMGPGTASDAITNYIIGNSVAKLKLQEHVAAANISGDLGSRFALAAPISVAAGLEYRKELGTQTVDATSAAISDGTGLRGFPSALQGKVGAWRTFNPQPFTGSYDIKEGYLELGVPLLRNVAFARSLDLNGAVRHAIYSQSGGVTTWKLGGVWDVNGAVRLRGTLSQDIRGPNLLELFNPGGQTLNNLTYQGRSVQSQNITSGNVNLRPEVARTFRRRRGAQARFPARLPDVGRLLPHPHQGRDRHADRAAGARPVRGGQCGAVPAVHRDLGGDAGGAQQDAQSERGARGGHRHGAGLSSPDRGRAAAIAPAGQPWAEQPDPGPGSPTVQLLGSTTTPKWSGVFQANYSTSAFSVFAQERMIGKAKLDPNLVDGVDISYADNTTPAVFYTDVTLTYNLKTAHKTQFYLTVNNLFDRDPPRSPPQVTSFAMAASSAYDQIGRYFTMGARMSF